MSQRSVSAVILAAGLSSRFGDDPPKQLAKIDGVPQIRRIACQALAADFREVIVVVGHRAEEVKAALAELPLRLMNHPDYASGLSSTVRAGLAAVNSQAAAALFIPCDQPFLDRATLQRLIAAYRHGRQEIVVPTHRNRQRAPVLWDRSLFDELATLTGDQGARQLLSRHRERIHTVEIADGRLVADFDTPEDLVLLLCDRPSAGKTEGR